MTKSTQARPRKHGQAYPSPDVIATPLVSDDQLFALRWDRGQRDIVGPFRRLYGAQADKLMVRLRALLESHWHARPTDLRLLDLQRDLNPDWFLSEKMIAYVFYIDNFAGDLKKLPARIPYLQDMGVTYAHMMPCLKPRPGASDGGYAVMDYRDINPDLGTMDDFSTATKAFRDAGISPCIDMVLNHTAKEHEWAQKARTGDAHYQAFYRMFDDDTLPKQYEKTLVEIFPEQASGNFTYYEDMDKWVWTTFNEYQWDLNWENPEVFLAILDTILFLANQGVEVFRLDAVAFMWKKIGTVCQNLPQVHDILQAMTQATRIAAPAVVHKVEAIVGPADLVPYLGTGTHAGRESQLAYHNNLMVQFWSSLAAQDTRLMTYVLGTHFPESARRASFAPYIRCHDDIGWAITPEDTAHIEGMQAKPHRDYLSDFYNGSFPGSFAHGADFQVNEETGDRRTNGTFASLAGLEAAIKSDDPQLIDLAVKRIKLGHTLIASYGGIPLIYMGDEVGLINDHNYLDDPTKADDSRWMQRPVMDWHKTAETDTPAARIRDDLRDILMTRKATPQLAGDIPTRVINIENRAVFAYARLGDDRSVTCLVNFTHKPQQVWVEDLPLEDDTPQTDLLTGEPMHVQHGMIKLAPYQSMWFRPI